MESWKSFQEIMDSGGEEEVKQLMRRPIRAWSSDSYRISFVVREQER